MPQRLHLSTALTIPPAHAEAAEEKEKSRGAEADPIYLIQGVKFQFPASGTVISIRAKR